MVATDLYGGLDAGIGDGVGICFDFGFHSMEDLRLSNDTGSFLFEHKLKAQTNAKDWFLATQLVIKRLSFRIVRRLSGTG